MRLGPGRRVPLVERYLQAEGAGQVLAEGEPSADTGVGPLGLCPRVAGS